MGDQSCPRAQKRSGARERARMSTTLLPNQLVDVGKDIVKLLVRLALAMTHRELRVDELAADCHLERAAVRGDRGSNRDLAGEFVLDERRQCGSESLVASAASVVDRHHWSTTGVVVLDGRAAGAALAICAAVTAATLAARAAVSFHLHVVVGRHDSCRE